MQIFVRSLNKTLVVNFDSETCTVQDLKKKIEDVEFIPPSFQRIELESASLDDSNFCGILENADTVTLQIDMVGGMRAKWRKKRMRRLRRKRRKMRNRAK